MKKPKIKQSNLIRLMQELFDEQYSEAISAYIKKGIALARKKKNEPQNN